MQLPGIELATKVGKSQVAHLVRRLTTLTIGRIFNVPYFFFFVFSFFIFLKVGAKTFFRKF